MMTCVHDATAATGDVAGPVTDQPPPLSSSRPSSRQGYPEQQPDRPRSRQSQYDYERRGAYDYRSDPRYAGYYGYGGYGEQDYYNQHQQRYMRGYEEEMRQYSAAGYVPSNRRRNDGTSASKIIHDSLICVVNLLRCPVSDVSYQLCHKI